jgi:hypothetical protein
MAEDFHDDNVTEKLELLTLYPLNLYFQHKKKVLLNIFNSVVASPQYQLHVVEDVVNFVCTTLNFIWTTNIDEPMLTNIFLDRQRNKQCRKCIVPCKSQINYELFARLIKENRLTLIFSTWMLSKGHFNTLENPSFNRCIDLSILRLLFRIGSSNSCKIYKLYN